MKIPHSCEVHRVLADEPTRYALDCAKLEIEDGKGRLIATNGRVLVVLPVELQDGDEPGLIPGEALGLSLPDDVQPEDLAFFKREVRMSNGRASFVRDERMPDAFPDWKKSIPAADDPTHFEVRISPRLLHDLARAMGHQTEYAGVKLRIPMPVNGQVRHPIRVEVDDAPGVYGSIMPIVREVPA